MEYDSEYVDLSRKDCYRENLDKVDAILTRINSAPNYRKERIDWDYLCNVSDDKHNAAYYIMNISILLINEGYTTYQRWKDKMLRFFSFLNEYNYSYCSDKELQTIVDGAWNSYLLVGFKGEAVWYKALKKLPLYKRWIMDPITTRLVGWIAFIMQAALVICVDFIFIAYITIALIISIMLAKRKVYGLGFIYTLSMISFNYIMEAFNLSFKNGSLIAMHDIQLYMLNYSYIGFFLCFLILYMNRQNTALLERARKNELIKYINIHGI